MSEPARSLPSHDFGRAASGPLRDWLAAMKAQVPAHESAPAPSAISAPVSAPIPAEAREEIRFEARPARGAETGWSPRLVPPAEASPAPSDDPDVAELMAENLMLKAELRLEGERQGDLRTLLADEIRALRQHVRDEVSSLEDLRADQDEIRAEREEIRVERERFRGEREGLRAERDRAAAERDALRDERRALAAERDALREERDLWRARSEALAQPLFQIQRR